MRTIGLIGGMSWESSLEYYRRLNEAVREKLGGFHSAQCVMYSVDFAEIEELQKEGNWEESARILIDAAQKVEKSGADAILLCTNTMHKLADEIQQTINVPLLHIADATAEKIKEKQLKKIGLLGTKFTMEEDFYKGRLERKHGLEVIVPDEKERQVIQEVIFNELCIGQIQEKSRDRFRAIIKGLAAKGARGIILGCTEIPLLVKQEDSEVPLFDTTRIHAEAAVEYALREQAPKKHK